MKNINRITLILLTLFSNYSYAEEEYGTHDYGCSIKEEDLTKYLTGEAIADVERKGEIKDAGVTSFQFDPTISRDDNGKYDFKFDGLLEGFILPGEQSIVHIPVINLHFAALNEDDIVYFCLYVDAIDSKNDHLTLQFFEGNHIRESDRNIFNRLPSVKNAPIAVELRIIENTIGKIGIFKKAINKITDKLHRFLDRIISGGTTKVFITPDDITLYSGLKVLDHTMRPKVGLKIKNPIDLSSIKKSGQTKNTRSDIEFDDEKEYYDPDAGSCD